MRRLGQVTFQMKRLVNSWGPPVIVAAVTLAWANSWSAPFELDDHSSILDNASIRHLWPPDWIHPPRTAGETVSGRPVLNFTFALNYAFGALDVRGYRAVNILVHTLAALTLFGLVRRTLAAGRASARPSPASASQGGLKPVLLASDATWAAFAIALIWAVHPLHTAAVTYVVQRAESLAGLFYLLTLYCFLRAGEASPIRLRWAAASVVACLLGMATKETVATAPLVVWLYDRAFLAGSFREAWRARGRLHLAFAATWLVPGALLLSNATRGGSAGFGAAIDAWSYLLTQCEAIVRYLALALWPASQVFDYGTPGVSSLGDVAVECVFLVALVVASARGMVRNHPVGFLGVCFFLLLAPSSSVVPVATQTIAEHRMYLPLAALVAVIVLGVARLGGSLPRAARFAAVAIVALALGLVTQARNRVYASELTLWRDTVVKRPDNARARNNLGNALATAGDVAGAEREYRAALVLQPQHAYAHFGLGTVLALQQRWKEALPHFAASLAAEPEYENARASLVEAHHALGLSRARERRLEEAAGHFRAILELRPADADAHANLGNVLLLQRDIAGALRHYEAAVRLRPDDPRLRDNIQLAREALAR